MSRKEYLIRREAVIDLKTSTRDAYRNEIRKDYFGNNEPVGQVSLPASDFNRSPAQSISAPQTTAGKTNLNDCSEQEISSLPGVGVALAKRAVELREQIGGFVSVQDFNQRLGLMPHFAVQIENLAFVEPNPSQTLTTEDSGRVIDI
jgi:DNA uptake protein ComE-like DNA-binding protein